MEVSAPIYSVIVGGSIECTAEYNTYDENNDLIKTTDVTDRCTWSSSNTSVAIVSSTGSVTSIAEGSATISATYKIGSINLVGSIDINVFNSDYDIGDILPDIGDRVPADTQTCPECGEEYDKDLAKCPHCGNIGTDSPSQDVIT